jgi:hypothetical protein
MTITDEQFNDLLAKVKEIHGHVFPPQKPIRYFVFKDKATGNIVQTLKGVEAPVPIDTQELIELSEKEFADFAVVLKEAEDNRVPVVHTSGTTFEAAEDTRLYVNVSVDSISSLTKEPITVTLQALNSDNTVNSDYSNEMKITFDICGELRTFLFTFSGGVASKQITTEKTGNFTIYSNDAIKVKEDVQIKFYE